MTLQTQLPSIDGLRMQAKRLRADLSSDGNEITHSRALEVLAHQYGYKDWNTLHAAAGNGPHCPVSLGQRVQGQYLGQAFEGQISGVQSLATEPDRFRVTVQFDQPVDVVTFDGFSNYRRRVTSVIDRAGDSAEKTSNGVPQMQLRL